MANAFSNIISTFSKKLSFSSASRNVGVPGTANYGGYLYSNETNSNLSNPEERYKVYSELLANTSIIAAGTRYFLNLIAKAEWTFNASDDDPDGKFAEDAKKMLTEDPLTPWHRIVRRASMYRFYGFSIQEWTAIRREDGVITLKDVAPRAQLTISKWNVDRDGLIESVVQSDPQTFKDITIPRAKLMYMVDDTLSDSPEGLGLFRHLVAPAQRLARYEQLEGIGYENDLRGMPVARGPFTKMMEKVAAGELTQDQYNATLAPIKNFVQNHIKVGNQGMLLDSMVYESADETGRPSANKQWDIELMKGSATSFKENALAIERLNHELARVLGVEQLMLGSGTSGSFALSRDKTSSFFMLVDSALTEVLSTVQNDLLKPLWELNGWDKKTMPKITIEAVKEADVAQIAGALRDLAVAGVPLAVDDPVVGELRDIMGVARPTEEMIREAKEKMEVDASLVATTTDFETKGPKKKKTTDPKDKTTRETSEGKANQKPSDVE